MPEVKRETMTAPRAATTASDGREAKHDAPGRPVANDGDGARLEPPREHARAPHPLVELTLVRLREFFREPEAVFWVFIFPVLLGMVLGVAFRNTGPEKIRIGIETDGQPSHAQAAKRIADALALDPGIETLSMSSEDAARALRSGKVSLVVRPQEEQGARAFNYRYDATRPESRAARLAVNDALQRAAGRADAATARDELVTEPGARYIDFLIPGLIGMNIMVGSIFSVGFSVVQARVRKLLKLLAATPMRRSDFLLSFVVARLVFLGPEVIAVLLFARFVFDVRIHGSLLSVAFIAFAGALMFGGIGLLIGARPRTVQGVSGLLNLVSLPMYMFSGVFFSTARFPEFLQPFIKALPLTALNDALRAVISDGASLAATWMSLLVIGIWALLSFALALRTFRWQ